jgi:hypothetical protein
MAVKKTATVPEGNSDIASGPFPKNCDNDSLINNT